MFTNIANVKVCVKAFPIVVRSVTPHDNSEETIAMAIEDLKLIHSKATKCHAILVWSLNTIL